MSTSHHNTTDKPAQPADDLVNHAAPGISYFTPLQDPPAGTALLVDGQKDVPKLFKPLKLRGVVRTHTYVYICHLDKEADLHIP